MLIFEIIHNDFNNPGRRYDDHTPWDRDTLDMFRDYDRGADPQSIGPLNGKHMMRTIKKLWNGKTGPKGSNIRRGDKRLIDIGNNGLMFRKSYSQWIIIPLNNKRSKAKWRLLKQENGKWYLVGGA